ncbi:MAG: hypothetical protein MUC94_10100 [bacterium]|jgi:hypothetical protein|nr:hypothetical protein [bacterium]
MTKKTNRPIKLLFLSLICPLFFIGCAARIPAGKYQLLQNSTSSLFNSTKDTYIRIEKLQRLYTVATAPDSIIYRDTFKPQIAGMSFDLTPELQFREQALAVLVKYVNVLCAFSAKDYAEEIDLAALELGASLNSFYKSCNGAAPSGASKYTGIFATLMSQLTRELTKQGKRNALKQSMDLAQHDIDEFATLFSGSNQKIKMIIGIMLDRIIDHANQVRPHYLTLERLPFDMKVAQVIAEAEAIESSLESLGTAVMKLARAHRELRQKLDGKATTLECLKEFVSEAKRLNEFYRNLN